MSRTLAAVPATPSATDDDEPRDWGKIAFRTFVVLLLATIAVAVTFYLRGQSEEEQNAALLRLIDTECGPGGSDPSAPLCVITAPQRADSAAAAATATGVDAAQVVDLVRAELDSREQNGESFTLADAEAMVRRLLEENRDLYRGEQGRPGDPPTDAQIQAAVAVVVAANQDRLRGEKGADGQSPPCLSEPGECRGKDGAAPVQITQRYPDGSTSVCTRDLGSPDSAPTYTCPTPTGGSDPDPGPDPTTDPPAENPPPTTDPDPEPGGLFG